MLFDFLPFDWLFVSLPSLNNEINSSLPRPVPLDPIMSTVVLLLHRVVARPRSKFIYKSLLAIWSFNVCGQTFCHYVIQIENYYLSAGRRTNCSCQQFFPLCISVELLFCSDEPSGVFFYLGETSLCYHSFGISNTVIFLVPILFPIHRNFLSFQFTRNLYPRRVT